MFLEIITPVKTLFSGEVALVKVPGKNGSFEILDHHAPIVSTLDVGEIRVVDNNKKVSQFKITGGVVEAKSNKVVLLVESV